MSTKTVLLLVGAAVVLTAVPDSVLSSIVKTGIVLIAVVAGVIYLQLILRAAIVLLTELATRVRNRWGWWRILILSRGPDTSTDRQYPVQLDLDTDTIEDYRR